MDVRLEKDIMRENRRFREEQYNARRQKDFEEALDREADFYTKAKQEYNEQTEMQLAQHREILAEKAAQKHIKNAQFCGQIVSNLIQIAFKVSEYRELNDNVDIPKRQIRQWKTLFLHDHPIDAKVDLEIDHDSIREVQEANNDTRDDPIDENIRILDQQEFSDYLDGNGDWTFDNVSRYVKFQCVTSVARKSKNLLFRWAR